MDLKRKNEDKLQRKFEQMRVGQMMKEENQSKII